MDRPIAARGFDDGHDRWSWHAARPLGAVAQLIERYTAYTESLASFSCRRELATIDGVFIVNLGSPLDITDAAGRAYRFGAGEGFIGGMSSATSLARNTGPMRGLHIHAPVLILARLAGACLADLANRVVPLSKLNPTLRDLARRLVDSGNPWEHLDTALTRRLAETPSIDRLTRHAMPALATGIPVETVAARLDISRKSLAARFRQATGFTPREFGRLARFTRFAAALRTSPAIPLAELAAAAGYADQPHATRETVRLTGTTPAALRKRVMSDGGVRDD